MITIPSWLALLLPATLVTGMFLGLWVKRGDYDDGWTDGTGQVENDAGLAREAADGELLPELPPWDDDSLALLRDEGGDGYCRTCGHYPAFNRCGDDCCDPGETTGPFDITSFGGPDERIATPARRNLALAFADLPLPDPSVLEQEWSWGKVAWQILEFRRWYADDSNWELAAAA